MPRGSGARKWSLALRLTESPAAPRCAVTAAASRCDFPLRPLRSRAAMNASPAVAAAAAANQHTAAAASPAVGASAAQSANISRLRQLLSGQLHQAGGSPIAAAIDGVDQELAEYRRQLSNSWGAHSALQNVSRQLQLREHELTIVQAMCGLRGETLAKCHTQLEGLGAAKQALKEAKSAFEDCHTELQEAEMLNDSMGDELAAAEANAQAERALRLAQQGEHERQIATTQLQLQNYRTLASGARFRAVEVDVAHARQLDQLQRKLDECRAENESLKGAAAMSDGEAQQRAITVKQETLDRQTDSSAGAAQQRAVNVSDSAKRKAESDVDPETKRHRSADTFAEDDRLPNVKIEQL